MSEDVEILEEPEPRTCGNCGRYAEAKKAQENGATIADLASMTGGKCSTCSRNRLIGVVGSIMESVGYTIEDNWIPIPPESTVRLNV